MTPNPFCLIDVASFENTTMWMEEVRTRQSNVSIILVGNKVDLAKRKVDSAEGKQKARDSKALFVETSAKTNSGIKEVSGYYIPELPMQIIEIELLRKFKSIL